MHSAHVKITELLRYTQGTESTILKNVRESMFSSHIKLKHTFGTFLLEDMPLWLLIAIEVT